MRTLITVLFLATLFGAHDASACTQCFAWLTPAGGDVPANLPAVRFGYLGPPVEAPLVTITEIDADGTERALEIEIDGDLARFARPLVPGATYRVRHPGCDQVEEAVFRATEAAPFPSRLGQLSSGVIADDSVVVPSASSLCASRADVRGQPLDLALSDEAQPWSAALELDWSTDAGGLADPRWNPEWSAPLTRFVFQVCASTDPELAPSSLSAPTTVVVSASIPGAAAVIAPAELDVALACSGREGNGAPSDEGADAGAAPKDGSESGCAARGGAPPLAVVLLLLLAGAMRLWRRAPLW